MISTAGGNRDEFRQWRRKNNALLPEPIAHQGSGDGDEQENEKADWPHPANG